MGENWQKVRFYCQAQLHAPIFKQVPPLNQKRYQRYLCITIPKIPIVFLLSQWQQRKSKILHFHSKFLLPKMTSAAIEIAGKLLGIWGRLWGPPKTAFTGLQKDTLTYLISLLVQQWNPFENGCIYLGLAVKLYFLPIFTNFK